MLSSQPSKPYFAGVLILQFLGISLALLLRYLRKKPHVVTFTAAEEKHDQLQDEEVALSFSSIPPIEDFDLEATEPYPYRPWMGGKFQMTMGIRKMNELDWLLLDNRYTKEQMLRKHLLDCEREGVMQCLPGSEEACYETLEYIVTFLTRRYPKLFYMSEKNPGNICNGITGKVFRIVRPLDMHPLEIAAQLVMEDVNLLIQGAGPDPEEHYL